jgi:pilus assembly protein Flp/PilA
VERFIRRILKDTRGATIIEYSLLIAFIAGALIVGLGNFTARALSMYSFIENKIDIS